MTVILEKYRKVVKDALSSYFTDDEITSIEVCIFNTSKLMKLEDEYSSQKLSRIYSNLAYEKVGELTTYPNLIKEIIASTNSMNVNWDSACFAIYKTRELTISKGTAPSIKEGAFQCKKSECRSWKCFYFQNQTRSADEGYTSYVVCSVCGHQYTLRG